MTSLVRADIEAMADSPILEVWRSGQGVKDLIALWAGESDLPTPRFICDAAMEALSAGQTFYTHNRGIPELRQAIVRYLLRHYETEISEDRIAVTTAGMNAVQIVCQALIEPGAEAVAVTPCWPNVLRAMAISGARTAEVPLWRGSGGWSLELDAVFAACGPKTKIIYLASPANPTGWMIEREQAAALLAFARERSIAIVSDEVYHRIVYDRPIAFSFIEIAKPGDAVFVVNSFSKSWAMTGWRIGWLISPNWFLDVAEKLIQFNTSGGQAFLQSGAVAALDKGDDFVARFTKRSAGGRAILSRRLSKMPRVREVPSSGAFYAMIEVEGVRDTLAFCKQALVKARIGMAPGIAFGTGAESLIRLCYAKSEPLLEVAMDRLEAHLRA